MGRDIIADIITSIRNTDINQKGRVQIVSTNITKNIIKILLREGLLKTLENIKKVKKISWFQPYDIQRLGKGI